MPAATFTRRQGEYLAYINHYTQVNGRPPAEADIASYFGVAGPTVHRMLVHLQERGLISRLPGVPRSLQILVDLTELPHPHSSLPRGAPPRYQTNPVKTAAHEGLAVARRILLRQFEAYPDSGLSEEAFAEFIAGLVSGVLEHMVIARYPLGHLAAVRNGLFEEIARHCATDDDRGQARPRARTFLDLVEARLPTGSPAHPL